MKKDKYMHCNLCQKGFSDVEFIAHLPSAHMPTSKFGCKKCSCEFTTVDRLQDHTNSEHSSNNEKVSLGQFNISDVFINSDDVVRHVENSPNWIRCAFTLGVDNILNKREMRSLIKDSFNLKTGNFEEFEACIFCSKRNHLTVYCYYCADSFPNNCHLKRHLLNTHVQLPSSLKKLVNFCDTCEKVFPSEKHLSQHRNREHKSGSPKKIEKTSPFCHFCGKSLANKSNLKRHVLNQHSEESGTTSNNSVFTCDYCKCYFSNKSSVKRHIENLHLKEKDTRKSISCFQCEQRFNSIKNLNAHLTVEHNVTITEEKLQFSDLNKFWDWKQDEEIRTNSRFIQLRGMRRQRRKGEEVSTLKFVCNRSGIFHSKSNGKRAYRIKGSSKIGRYCSAYIEIMFKDNATVDGIYCSTHSGHDNDLRYLTLTMDEKREIYEKIKNGSTFSSILNEIRNSVGKEIKRKHLVTNKDLHNIVTTFKKLSKSPEAEAISENQTATSHFNANDCQLEPQNCDRAERTFNNDLDICADLWVETCQRMVNRFDHIQPQHQPRLGTEVCKNIIPDSKSTKNVFIDEERLHDSFRSKSDFSRDVTPYNGSSGYTPNCVPQSITPSWNKSSNFPIYTPVTNQDESRLNMVDMSYYNGLTRPVTINNPRKEVTDFCGIPSMTYPVSTTQTNDSVARTLPNDTKMMSSCANAYGVMNTSTVNEVDSSMYMRHVGDDYKLPNSDLSSPADIFIETYVVPNESQLAGHDVPPSSPEIMDSLQDPLEDDINESGDETEAVISAENKSKETNHDVSDLRDRVNSVTALYNIVESELDERKKNIIRNYVDNMFRVLQYRYNKCKTKKKQNGVRRTQQKSKVQKKISRRRRPNNGTGVSRGKLLGKPKSKQLSQQKPVGQYSCSSAHFTSSKSANPYPTINAPLVTSMRPEMNVMCWEY